MPIGRQGIRPSSKGREHERMTGGTSVLSDGRVEEEKKKKLRRRSEPREREERRGQGARKDHERAGRESPPGARHKSLRTDSMFD